MKSAGFGWEVANLNNCGANAYVPVVGHAITLHTVDIDVSFMLTSLPSTPGYLEILCRGAVSRGGARFDDSSQPAYLAQPSSLDFGSVSVNDPNQLHPKFDSALAQDLFASVILKGFASQDGVGASPSRHVSLRPELVVNPGDYLVFHLDHLGVPGDAEMQIVVGYDFA